MRALLLLPFPGLLVHEPSQRNESVARVAHDDDDVRTTTGRPVTGRMTMSPLQDDLLTTTTRKQDDVHTTMLGWDDVHTTMEFLNDDVLTTARKCQEDVGTTMDDLRTTCTLLVQRDDLTTQGLRQGRKLLLILGCPLPLALLQEGRLRVVLFTTCVSTAARA